MQRVFSPTSGLSVQTLRLALMAAALSLGDLLPDASGFTPERKYPLVLLIHGGPQAASTLSFSRLAQLIAARDYIVFSPNYRGSDNLGNAYERAIFNDAGDGPGRDVMAGIQALEQKGSIDPSRIAVSGWSYGGYMTSWLIGHYHIWKAAVSGAAVNDLLHEYALSDGNVTLRYSFGGPPWSEKLAKAYQEQSPISYARHITTPTLILSDTGDARVPITESYLMYHALKDNGVTVQFFGYPVAGHSPGDPVRQPDVYRRWVEWLDRYLRAPQEFSVSRSTARTTPCSTRALQGQVQGEDIHAGLTEDSKIAASHVPLQ